MKGTKIDPVCISSGQCGCQGSPRRHRAVGHGDGCGPGSLFNHSREWLSMGDKGASVLYCSVLFCSAEEEIIALPCPALPMQSSASVLWGSLPVLKDLVKGDIDLLLLLWASMPKAFFFLFNCSL